MVHQPMQYIYIYAYVCVCVCVSLSLSLSLSPSLSLYICFVIFEKENDVGLCILLSVEEIFPYVSHFCDVPFIMLLQQLIDRNFN